MAIEFPRCCDKYADVVGMYEINVTKAHLFFTPPLKNRIRQHPVIAIILHKVPIGR
jgi:hypothetical protein